MSSAPGAMPYSLSTKNPSDAGIAITILVSTLLVAFLSVLYVYRGSIFRSKASAASNSSGSINFLNNGKKDGSNVSQVTVNATKNGGKASKEFTPPKEVAEFYEAKETLDKKDLEQLNTLKKKLINRAIRVIPIIFSLEREGQSIERLYKKGILTDDIHFNTLAMKNFVDQELKDVKEEAENILEGWGDHIWSQAVQFHGLYEKKMKEREQAEQDGFQ